MTSSLRAIRLGLKTQLETISGLRAYDVWPTTINPPVAVVRPLSGIYHEDMGETGSVTHQLEITVLLQLGDQRVAQEQMDEYLASVPIAVEADSTLGGAAQSTSVTGWRDYGTMRVGADEEGRSPEFLGVRFDVEVFADMHVQALEFARRILADLHVTGHVVEIGSRDINGSVRPLFVDAASYTGVDIAPGPGVDVVADGASYVPSDLSVHPSMVVCMEVIEHTPDGKAIIANAARILERGGWLLVTCATEPRAPHSARDGGEIQTGEHYQNVAPADLRSWFANAGLGVAIEEFYTDRGDLYALGRKR